MKKYHVSIPWFASVTVTVEAQSVEEAIDKAIDEADASLCHSCSNNINVDGGPDYDHLNGDCVDEAGEP